MTKKTGPRGPAPKRPKSWVDATSYWADEKVPDLADLFLENDPIAVSAFVEWLGPTLGRYRGKAKIKANWPSPSEEADVLRSLREHSMWVQAALHGGPPPIAATELGTRAIRAGIDWSSLSASLSENLITLAVLAAAVERDARAVKVPRGRPRAITRDALAAEIVEKLREQFALGAEAARELARAVMQRAGVPAPDDLKRAVKKGQK